MDFYRDAVLTNSDEERRGADLTGTAGSERLFSLREKKFNIVPSSRLGSMNFDIHSDIQLRVLAVSVCFIGLIWNKQPPATLLLINPIKFYTENVYISARLHQ